MYPSFAPLSPAGGILLSPSRDTNTPFSGLIGFLEVISRRQSDDVTVRNARKTLFFQRTSLVKR